jgi:hypothetical protein
MKRTFWALAILGGLLTSSQAATAAFVFNPTLTMPQTYDASSSRLIKVEMPAAKDRWAPHKVCDGVKDERKDDFSHPKITMYQ